MTVSQPKSDKNSRAMLIASTLRKPLTLRGDSIPDDVKTAFHSIIGGLQQIAEGNAERVVLYNHINTIKTYLNGNDVDTNFKGALNRSCTPDFKNYNDLFSEIARRYEDYRSEQKNPAQASGAVGADKAQGTYVQWHM